MKRPSQVFYHKIQVEFLVTESATHDKGATCNVICKIFVDIICLVQIPWL